MNVAVFTVLACILAIIFAGTPKKTLTNLRPLSQDQKDLLRGLVQQGQEVEAMRRYRQYTGASLKAAVEAVREWR